MLFETTAPMPLWRDAYLARDQRPSYAYLLRVLKVLQWLRGGTRWVLKSPQHLEQFPALVDTFPDATFVVTHRDPVSVTASMVTMIAYTRPALRATGSTSRRSATTGPTGSSACCGRCAAERDVLPADQTIDVHFDEFMEDDLAMVGRVYDLAGQPLDEQARSSMAAFMAAHPRGRHGAVAYDLGDFGLDVCRASQGARLLHRSIRHHARVLSRSAIFGGSRQRYSVGRRAMAEGSRPANNQPTAVARIGMAITIRKRLDHGTWRQAGQPAVELAAAEPAGQRDVAGNGAEHGAHEPERRRPSPP